MEISLPSILAVISLAVSAILTIVVIVMLKRDKNSEKDRLQEINPVLIEAEKVSQEIGPLLERVESLKDVVIQGRIHYEARILELQKELAKSKNTPST